jgi:hypothetical protein
LAEPQRMVTLWIVMATKRRPPQRKPAEFATPPAGPVPWRVTMLRGKRAKVPPIVARSWFEARAIAMVTHGVEAWQVEVRR